MKKQQYLQSEKYSRLIFIACFAAYSASYIGRINFSAALPAIIGDGFFTKTEAGIIGSAFFIVYGAFQIINGFLGDKISPFKMITAGTFLSAVANVTMTFCTTNIQMAIVWGFNGFALSLLWASILKILANIINDGMRSKACLNISVTLPIGTILAYLFASFSIKFFNWRFVFYIPAAILFIICVFFTVSSLIVKPHITEREIVAQSIPQKKKAKGGLLPLLLMAGIFIILPADAIHGAIKEGITTWVPTMITEVYSTAPSFSVFLSILLPVFNITGVYIITPIYNKIFKKDELKTGAGILLFALIPLSLLIFMEKLPVVASVALLAIITTSLHSFNYMIITLVPMHFSYCGRTATVTGIMNATAYVGCAAATYGFGVISDKIGWNGSIFVWIGLAITALLVTLSASGKWKRFKESTTVKEQ
ncbi:MAG: MFS transporter [Acutalibacteraceae bacterium]|nr:MFS transporter [Acutalibacteraceae bacterium]